MVLMSLCTVQILAGSSVVGAQASNYLKVYKVTAGTATATLKYGPLTIPTGLYGSPGGNGAGAHPPIKIPVTPSGGPLCRVSAPCAVHSDGGLDMS